MCGKIEKLLDWNKNWCGSRYWLCDYDSGDKKTKSQKCKKAKRQKDKKAKIQKYKITKAQKDKKAKKTIQKRPKLQKKTKIQKYKNTKAQKDKKRQKQHKKGQKIQQQKKYKKDKTKTKKYNKKDKKRIKRQDAGRAPTPSSGTRTRGPAAPKFLVEHWTECTFRVLEQDGIYCQRPTPPPTAFSVPNRNVLYLRETKLWRCERGGRGETCHCCWPTPLH